MEVVWRNNNPVKTSIQHRCSVCKKEFGWCKGESCYYECWKMYTWNDAAYFWCCSEACNKKAEETGLIDKFYKDNK